MSTTLRLVTTLVLLTGVVYAQRSTAPAAEPWPAFRGVNTSGSSSTAQPPLTWNISTSTNVVWRTAVPGLGHSSPVIWGDRVYVTTAVGSGAAAQAVALGDSDRAGIDPANDLVSHRWQLLALDRATGRIVWTRTVHEGVPRVKRHAKSSHASATPVTNGRLVIAMFGSEGLVAFNAADGAELWRKDFGRIAVGLADEPEYEWGPASSPIIQDDRVIVQIDRYKDSFLAAFNLANGQELWRVRREERPGWTTPLVQKVGDVSIIVAVSPFFVRGHDLATGSERWRLADPEGQVKVSSPVAAGELAIVTGGWPAAARPIIAVSTRDGSVRWRTDRGSPYTTTPLVYGDLVYVLTDNGILSAYQVADGRRVYQTRIPPEFGTFSASPVAAADRLYLTSEDGKVIVVRAGTKAEFLAVNDMNEVCMATPALSGDLLLMRTKSALYALGRRPAS